jgi:hypothetical protein
MEATEWQRSQPYGKRRFKGRVGFDAGRLDTMKSV